MSHFSYQAKTTLALASDCRGGLARGQVGNSRLHAIAERYHLVDPAHGEQSNSLNIMRRPFLLNQHHDDGKPADMWP